MFEAAQESIVDQQQTIEKFRELVRHLQAEIADLRQRGESLRVETPEGTPVVQSQAIMSLSQLKTSAIKAHSRVRGGRRGERNGKVVMGGRMGRSKGVVNDIEIKEVARGGGGSERTGRGRKERGEGYSEGGCRENDRGKVEGGLREKGREVENVSRIEGRKEGGRWDEVGTRREGGRGDGQTSQS